MVPGLYGGGHSRRPEFEGDRLFLMGVGVVRRVCREIDSLEGCGATEGAL